MQVIVTHPTIEALSATSPVGRDELNLAEFPIALLTDRAAQGQKTLQFEDLHGRLTVTGSDAHGLPTAVDADVIVVLIYLTKQRTNFRDARVSFSLGEVIRLLNWPEDGKSFQRLKGSFSRWVGVSLHYDRCWWNNRLKAYTTAQMHIIESVELVGREANKGRSAGRADWEPSSFTWNRKFIESCQADNLRQLDLDTYFALKSAISKRLYRFLGKRFHIRADWTFDLDEIAFERVGLSRGYKGDAGKIKEKLQPALAELEGIGFLEPLARPERYTRVDRGRWVVRLARPAGAPDLALGEWGPATVEPGEPPPATPAADPPLVAGLIGQGVDRATALDLVAGRAADRVQLQLDVLAWHLGTRPGKVADPASWLAAAIRADRNPPKAYAASARRRASEVTDEHIRRLLGPTA